VETKSKIVNRAATARPAAAPLVQRATGGPGGTAVRVQTALRVSSPADPAEREAESTAKRIMRMALADRLPGPSGPPVAPRPPIGRSPAPEVRRKAEGLPDVGANVAAEIQASDAAGQPLPASVRRFMEPRFRADFGGVRIHTSDRAATLNRQLAARAFTVGRQVYFGRDQFRPENEEGKELIAHELTHTIQQGSVAQRSEDPGVRLQAPVQVQRLGISDALDYFADKAYNIPGYRMFTILLGVNPINMSRVERSAANILRAIVEFLPGGHVIVEALENYGIFDKIGRWVDDQLTSLGITGGAIRKAINDFLDSLGWRDIFHLGRVWDRAKRIFTDPIDRIITFVKNLAVAILKFVKDAILRPLAGLAAKTRGYDLIKAILGQDPITGDPYPRNADTLIGGFMKLIGQEEVWENIKKANAIARAWAWFQGALSGLMAFVTAIPRQFIATLQSLTIGDIVVLPKAFAKVAGFFVDTAVRFVSWALEQVLSLLQIIFEVLAPGAMVYLRKAQAAFRTIVRNPIGFIRNLVRAGIQGFRQFGTNFLTHLKNALIQWITGTMAGSNIYLPKAFTIPEIIKFVLSVLGLTWQNIRAKLVKVIGEPAMAALETGFDIVVTLVREGPAAAWEKIQEAIGNLRDMVMDQVMTFVREKIVTAAVTKLLTSLNPAGAFIQAVIAIYNTVMFLVERLKQIGQVAMSVIDAIAAIAAGVIVPAANKVEQTMAGLLTLVISFLARLVGLGNVSEAVSNVIAKVRAPIDKALDRVVEWIVATATKIGKLVVGAAKGAVAKVKAILDIPDKSSPVTLVDGEQHTVFAGVHGGVVTVEMASSVRSQMDLVLGRLAALCAKASKEYGAALTANPTKKARIEETMRALDNIITITRKTYRGPGSVYLEVENIISGSYAPYDGMTPAQRTDAAERFLSRFVASVSSRLRAEVKVGFTILEGLKYKSGYVDEGGLLLAKYRGNVRRHFYGIAWGTAALGFRSKELKQLNALALSNQPALAGTPDAKFVYWSADATGGASMAPHAADMRTEDGAPELDHKEPLAVRWLNTGKPEPGNNATQAERDKDYNDVGNLQVLSSKMNRSKSGPPFSPQVEVKFRGPLDPP
jgi:hypothetical protein